MGARALRSDDRRQRRPAFRAAARGLFTRLAAFARLARTDRTLMLPASPTTFRHELRPAATVSVLLGVVGVGLGFASRRPELVALGAPATALLVPGLLAAHRRTASLSLDARLIATPTRVAMGEDITIGVELVAPSDVARCALAVRLPAGVHVVAGAAAAEVALTANMPCTHTFVVRTSAVGSCSFGPAVVRIDDRSGLVRSERVITATTVVNVVPVPVALRSILRAMTTGMHIGEQVSRRRGDGFEFSDLRPYAPGDPARRVHWAASARRDDPVVVDRRPDRNQEVVLLLDGHANFIPPGRGDASEPSTLQRSMEAAAAIAAAHLAARDRVGFVGFGSYVSWLRPGTGIVAKSRLLDAIVSVSTENRGLGRFITAVPGSARPRHALVVVVTPLIDGRSANVIQDLRSRNYDVAVVVVTPDMAGPEGSDDVVSGLWRVVHGEMCADLAHLGCAVVAWPHGTPLEAAVREVIAWRQQVLRSRA